MRDPPPGYPHPSDESNSEVTIFARRHARLRSEEVILTSRLSCPPRKLDGYLGEASEGPPLFGAALSFAFQAWVLAITVLAFHRQPNARQAAPAGFMKSSSTAFACWPGGTLPACAC
jgi:hypothetical protein